MEISEIENFSKPSEIIRTGLKHLLTCENDNDCFVVSMDHWCAAYHVDYGDGSSKHKICMAGAVMFFEWGIQDNSSPYEVFDELDYKNDFDSKQIRRVMSLDEFRRGGCIEKALTLIGGVAYATGVVAKCKGLRLFSDLTPYNLNKDDWRADLDILADKFESIGE